MKKYSGFSLIEIVVVVGILSMLLISTYFIGLPEYSRFVISTEKDYLADALLESRTKSLAGDESLTLAIWPTGYCIQNTSNVCVMPFHNLPVNMALKKNKLATTTQYVIEDGVQTEIITEKYGYIDGR